MANPPRNDDPPDFSFLGGDDSSDATEVPEFPDFGDHSADAEPDFSGFELQSEDALFANLSEVAELPAGDVPLTENVPTIIAPDMDRQLPVPDEPQAAPAPAVRQQKTTAVPSTSADDASPNEVAETPRAAKATPLSRLSRISRKPVAKAPPKDELPPDFSAFADIADIAAGRLPSFVPEENLNADVAPAEAEVVAPAFGFDGGDEPEPEPEVVHEKPAANDMPDFSMVDLPGQADFFDPAAFEGIGDGVEFPDFSAATPVPKVHEPADADDSPPDVLDNNISSDDSPPDFDPPAFEGIGIADNSFDGAEFPDFSAAATVPEVDEPAAAGADDSPPEAFDQIIESANDPPVFAPPLFDEIGIADNSFDGAEFPDFSAAAAVPETHDPDPVPADDDAFDFDDTPVAAVEVEDSGPPEDWSPVDLAASVPEEIEEPSDDEFEAGEESPESPVSQTTIPESEPVHDTTAKATAAAAATVVAAATASAAAPSVATGRRRQQDTVSKKSFKLLAAYAAALTLLVVTLFATGRISMSGRNSLESLPDIEPLRDGEFLKVPDGAALPDGHVLKLGESRRFGDVVLTPLKVTREPVAFINMMSGAEVKNQATQPLLKLWFQIENVSDDIAFRPWELSLMCHRTPPYSTADDTVANTWLMVHQEDAEAETRVLNFFHSPDSALDVRDISSQELLQPGQTMTTFIVASEGFNQLPQDSIESCRWRILLRKGIHVDSGHGVTTLVDVRFTPDDIVL